MRRWRCSPEEEKVLAGAPSCSVRERKEIIVACERERERKSGEEE
jgi:hypothetical protein